jgi:hypothetical protein
MNGELQAETREFECDLMGQDVRGTVTKYLDGMVNPNDPSFKGVRYTVFTRVNGIRYKFTMFHEGGQWHSRLLSVYGDDTTRLASLDTFVLTNKSIEYLFEDALHTLSHYQPQRLDEDEDPPLSLFDKINN